MRWIYPIIIAAVFLAGCDMYEGLYKSTARVKNPKRQVISYGPFNGGLVTDREAERCARNECPELLNMVLETHELARTRDGVSLVCSGADGAVCCARDIQVGGDWYTIIGAGDASGNGYLYMKDGTGLEAFQNDDQLCGPPRVAGFNDMLMIFDGGILKYWHGEPWHSSITYQSIWPGYDDGIGADAYLFDGALDEDKIIPVEYVGVPLGGGAGTTNRAGARFTVPEIDGGATSWRIPWPTVTVKLCRVGAGYTGTETPVKVKIILDSSDTDIVEADIVMPSDLPQVVSAGGGDADDYQEYTYTFTNDDMISPSVPPGSPLGAGLLGGETYKFSVEFGGGDASNYVYTLKFNTTLATGNLYTGNPWTGPSDSWQATVMRGKAPNAVDGIVHANRLFVIEGEDGDNPERLWYSGAGNPFDWSSPNSGGYIDTGKPIGGIASFYGDVWIFGTTKEPGLRRLTGDQPVDYAIEDTMQQVAGHFRSLVTTPDDVFFLHPAGMDSVRVMQEYGDVRSISQTDAIKNIVMDNYDTDAVAGYDPDSGGVLLKLNDATDSVYVVHTRMKQARQMGDIVYQVSPIAEWVFNLPQISGNDQAPTVFGRGDGYAYIGTDQGAVYRINSSVVTDAGNAATYRLRTAYMSSRFGEMNARRVNFDIFSENGGTFRLNFYTNHSRTVLFYEAGDLPTNLTPTDPDDPATDDFNLNFDRFNVNFPFRSLMMEINNITLNGHNPIYIGGISVMGFNKGNL